MSGHGKRLAIFDMDGTLVEFAIDSRAARQDVIDYFDTVGIPGKVLDITNSILDLFTRARMVVQEDGLPEPDWDEVRRQVLAIIERHERAAAEVSRPVPGIHDTLDTLAREDVLMAVCTLNTTANASAVLEKHGLARFFEVIAGRDVVSEHMKPDPGHGIHIVERLGMPLDHCVMIGDHPADIQMAVGMGIAAVAITSTRHGPAEFDRFPGVELVPDSAYERLAAAILRVLDG